MHISPLVYTRNPRKPTLKMENFKCVKSSYFLVLAIGCLVLQISTSAGQSVSNNSTSETTTSASTLAQASDSTEAPTNQTQPAPRDCDTEINICKNAYDYKGNKDINDTEEYFRCLNATHCEPGSPAATRKEKLIKDVQAILNTLPKNNGNTGGDPRLSGSTLTISVTAIFVCLLVSFGNHHTQRP